MDLEQSLWFYNATTNRIFGAEGPGNFAKLFRIHAV